MSLQIIVIPFLCLFGLGIAVYNTTDIEPLFVSLRSDKDYGTTQDCLKTCTHVSNCTCKVLSYGQKHNDIVTTCGANGLCEYCSAYGEICSFSKGKKGYIPCCWNVGVKDPKYVTKFENVDCREANDGHYRCLEGCSALTIFKECKDEKGYKYAGYYTSCFGSKPNHVMACTSSSGGKPIECGATGAACTGGSGRSSSCCYPGVSFICEDKICRPYCRYLGETCGAAANGRSCCNNHICFKKRGSDEPTCVVKIETG